MSDKYIQLVRSESTLWLLENYPYAFLLLTLIAYRARRTLGHIDGKEIGDADIGDWKSCGLSEQQYRTAKNKLVEFGMIRIQETCRSRKKGSTKGTLVQLLRSDIFDINPNFDKQQYAVKNETKNAKTSTTDKSMPKSTTEFPYVNRSISTTGSHRVKTSTTESTTKSTTEFPYVNRSISTTELTANQRPSNDEQERTKNIKETTSPSHLNCCCSSFLDSIQGLTKSAKARFLKTECPKLSKAINALKAAKDVGNPGGFLTTALKDGYVSPKTEGVSQEALAEVEKFLKSYGHSYFRQKGYLEIIGWGNISYSLKDEEFKLKGKQAVEFLDNFGKS